MVYYVRAQHTFDKILQENNSKIDYMRIFHPQIEIFIKEEYFILSYSH